MSVSLDVDKPETNSPRSTSNDGPAIVAYSTLTSAINEVTYLLEDPVFGIDRSEYPR